MNKIVIAVTSTTLGFIVLALVISWLSDNEQVGKLAPSVIDCQIYEAGEACNDLLELGVSPEPSKSNKSSQLEISEIAESHDPEEMENPIDLTYLHSAENSITLPETFTQRWSYAKVSQKQKNTKQLQFIATKCLIARRENSRECLELLELGIAPRLYLNNQTYLEKIFKTIASATEKSDPSLLKDLDVYTHEFASENGISLPESYTSRWPKP
ncbi:hypothetical protein Q7A_2686 [Methylophaga nitratireducenticrescens]|uniref:hypothetical protein n=1 Tax=Methylophaga nitratireducenticrescens TaxID=754476 RepID=UPI000B7A1EE0|nr:hypothetical protein [Methylophaga nitratireducenticrescens]AFI85474.2 hypothetical protein Q7A_2686 [Methylophaga nitratireducenticrescens]